MKLISRADQEYERIVFAEVLIPDTPNSYGDFHTKESVREAAYLFMRTGFGVDIGHDNVDVSSQVIPVESFIARENDPDFIVGSWVLGFYVGDDDIWQKILDGELNGFSYEAFVRFFPVELIMDMSGPISGVTGPNLYDRHVHDFYVVVTDGEIVSGGTTVTNGHSHTISRTTITDEADGHTHIFNFIR